MKTRRMCPYRHKEHASIVAVYIPPSADAAVAEDCVHYTVSTQYTTTSIIITGDFNHTSLDYILPTFHQLVYGPSRDYKTLDLLYANTAIALSPVGMSDHNLVLLTPKYVPLMKRQPLATHSVRGWTQEAGMALQDCFESTYCDVLCMSHGDDIGFCKHTLLPTQNVHCQQYTMDQ